MKRETDLKALYFGTPVVLISSLNADGTTNLAPMSSAWWLGRTAVLGMGSASQTVRNLRERSDCVLNLVDASMVGAVDRLALLTGRPEVPTTKQARGYTYEADKFGASGLRPVAVPESDVQAVVESPVHLSGVVQEMHAVQGEGSGLLAIEVRVLGIRVEQELLLGDASTTSTRCAGIR